MTRPMTRPWALMLAYQLWVASQPGCASELARLSPGLEAQTPAVALSHRATLARGALGYGAAFAGERYLVTVELTDGFFLVIRDAGRAGRMQERSRTWLGPAEHDIEDLAVDDERRRAFVASRDGSVRGYDIPTGALLVTWRVGSPSTAVAVSPDGALVAMGTADGVLCLRRYQDGALLQCLAPHGQAPHGQARISGLDFSADGGQLASASWAGEVIRWRVPSLAMVEKRSFPGAICGLAFAPRGGRLALARSGFPPERSAAVVEREARRGHDTPHPDHAVTIWGASAGEIHLTGHGGPVTSVAWTPDGRRLLTGSWDRTVRLWDIEGARELHRLAGFSLLIRDLAVDPGARRVAVAAWTRGRSGRASAVLDLLYPASSIRRGSR